MKSFAFALATLALVLGSVIAVPTKRTSHGSTSGDYHMTHGKSFPGGYYYSGRDHHHWSYWGYPERYRYMCYWYPSSTATTTSGVHLHSATTL